MLRPQVFALQQGQGAHGIGLAASERQAIDAALESLAREDPRFWSRADRYWNARGGSHTDGGAFVFTAPTGAAGAGISCTDKFGQPITVGPRPRRLAIGWADSAAALARRDLDAAELFDKVRRRLPAWDYGDLQAFLDALLRTAEGDGGRDRALAVVTLLMDRRCPPGAMQRSRVLSLLDTCLEGLVEAVRRAPSRRYAWVGGDGGAAACGPEATLVLDARGFTSEGDGALSRRLVDAHRQGVRRFIVASCRGHRFIGCGLGPGSRGVRIDVYGASGDYLASGIDGAEIVVHGAAQDQVAQVMKDGRLVVHGDVGQTFMYAAKGGTVFVLGSAAGRPLINAVGRPRVVINGTCLDYLAESFMAGDPLDGGGFAVLNGVVVGEDGEVSDLDSPYPGGNLFSLASGGAIYVRDPEAELAGDQLNGGEFAELTARDWDLIRPLLEENERIFGIPLCRLLTVDGRVESAQKVYRKIRPAEHPVLSPEEAWVRQKA